MSDEKLKQLVDENFRLAEAMCAAIGIAEQSLGITERSLPKVSEDPSTWRKWTVVYVDLSGTHFATAIVTAKSAQAAQAEVEEWPDCKQVVAVFKGEHVNQID